MPTIVHFDIASDDPQRAKEFYQSLFGWKIASPPGMEDYYLVETKDLEGKSSVGGGLGKRMGPSQKITCYIGVDLLEEYTAKVKELGGMVIVPKISVPGWGHMATCIDTEGNPFGLWQDDKSAA